VKSDWLLADDDHYAGIFTLFFYSSAGESLMPQGGAPKHQMVEAPSWRFKAAGCRFYTIF
jgi:hypothetical protein